MMQFGLGVCGVASTFMHKQNKLQYIKKGNKILDLFCPDKYISAPSEFKFISALFMSLNDNNKALCVLQPAVHRVSTNIQLRQ